MEASMDWEKPSSELGDILSSAADSFPAVERRKMFGGLALFYNGQMLAGVHGKKIVVRLSEGDRAEAQTSLGAEPFEPMPGRTMKEYVVMPEIVWSDVDALERWLERAVEFVGNLPPKEPKPRKPRLKT
jgi:TfoX/Sxy family transcriptional regulator of competence genes